MQSCSQIINTQLFTGLMPFLSPNRQCQSMLDKKKLGMSLIRHAVKRLKRLLVESEMVWHTNVQLVAHCRITVR